MDGIRDAIIDLRRITPADDQWFFGYYDTPAFSRDDRRHLAHRVAFRDRLPKATDVAELAIIDLETLGVAPIAETRAWNFQQGCMFQWVGERNAVLFNNDRGGGRYGSVLRDFATGEERQFDLPVTNLARSGKRALSVNFDRMFDFRPGYGYCGKKDPFAERNHPAEDGVFLLDTETGESRLILSLQTLWEEVREAYRGADMKLAVNHITFNPAADRFVLLVRNFATKEMRWVTSVFVSDLEGRVGKPLCAAAMASHYWWTDDRTVMFWSDGPEGQALYLIDAETGEHRTVDPEFFRRDGHCSTSPDGRWLLYDSYPKDGYRFLFLYDLRGRKGVTLAGLRDMPVDIVDIRCDLHPRWNRAGTGISLDATHEGFRGIYTADLRDVMTTRFE